MLHILVMDVKPVKGRQYGVWLKKLLHCSIQNADKPRKLCPMGNAIPFNFFILDCYMLEWTGSVTSWAECCLIFEIWPLLVSSWDVWTEKLPINLLFKNSNFIETDTKLASLKSRIIFHIVNLISVIIYSVPPDLYVIFLHHVFIYWW